MAAQSPREGGIFSWIHSLGQEQQQLKRPPERIQHLPSLQVNPTSHQAASNIKSPLVVNPQNDQRRPQPQHTRLPAPTLAELENRRLEILSSYLRPHEEWASRAWHELLFQIHDTIQEVKDRKAAVLRDKSISPSSRAYMLHTFQSDLHYLNMQLEDLSNQAPTEYTGAGSVFGSVTSQVPLPVTWPTCDGEGDGKRVGDAHSPRIPVSPSAFPRSPSQSIIMQNDAFGRDQQVGKTLGQKRGRVESLDGGLPLDKRARKSSNVFVSIYQMLLDQGHPVNQVKSQISAMGDQLMQKAKSLESQVQVRTRDEVIASLRDAIETRFLNVTVEVSGSYATGLCLPKGDIDLVIIDGQLSANAPSRQGQASSKLSKLARNLYSQASKLEILSRARIPIIKLITKHGGHHVDIAYHQPDSITAVPRIIHWVECIPGLKYLVLTLKNFLLERQLNQVFNGGVGGFGCVVWALTFISIYHGVLHTEVENPRQRPALKSFFCGDLWLAFMHYFGKKFNYRQEGLDWRQRLSLPSHIIVSPKPVCDGPSGPFFLQDPFKSETSNIARGSTAILRIRDALSQEFDKFVSSIALCGKRAAKRKKRPRHGR